MSKKTKKKFEDPGISFTNMNVPGMPYNKHMKHADEGMQQKPQLSGREKRKLIIAGFAKFLPILLIVVVSFTIAAVIMWLWLGGACR